MFRRSGILTFPAFVLLFISSALAQEDSDGIRGEKSNRRGGDRMRRSGQHTLRP